MAQQRVEIDASAEVNPGEDPRDHRYSRLGVVSSAASAAPRSISVAVVGADAADPRWGVTEEAVDYRNDQLAEIGAGIRLGPLTRLVQPLPQFLTELASLPGDIIVVLSMLNFISFGHPWSPGQKGLSRSAAGM